MEAVIEKTLSAVEFRESQTFENMVVLPLISELTGGPGYITLGEALDARTLTVTEIDKGGSVPELKVVCESDIPVLLLDGEELMGAKQNRVVNTTILIKERSVTTIPVSCTEQGRWSYRSEAFADSDVVLSRQVRTRKMASVHANLRGSREYRSDQHEVWDSIQEMSMAAGVASPTGAQRDVFEKRSAEIGEYLEAFPCVSHQRGLLAFVNGKIVGFDFVSSESAYEKLHTKLVKSYAMDALLRHSHRSKAVPDLNGGKAFLKEVLAAKEESYDSIGYGKDHRFEGKFLVGSALVHDDFVIHMAFFATEGKVNDVGPMTSARSRMGFRIDNRLEG